MRALTSPPLVPLLQPAGMSTSPDCRHLPPPAQCKRGAERLLPHPHSRCPGTEGTERCFCCCDGRAGFCWTSCCAGNTAELLNAQPANAGQPGHSQLRRERNICIRPHASVNTLPCTAGSLGCTWHTGLLSWLRLPAPPALQSPAAACAADNTVSFGSQPRTHWRHNVSSQQVSGQPQHAAFSSTKPTCIMHEFGTVRHCLRALCRSARQCVTPCDWRSI